MADNTRLNQGAGGDLIATDEISGAKYQRVKITTGADGVNDGDVSSSNPIPAIMYGQNDSGNPKAFNATSEGHIEAAIHAPRLPFGSVHVENITPVFQCDAVYGINNLQVSNKASGSGAATASDSAFIVSTGTTIYSQGIIQSRKRLRYRAGQGVVGRFTALYSAPAASAYQVAGFGHAEDGVYFGYVGTAFGILYVNRGVRETRTFTVTTGSSTAESITITLNGVANSVSVTNSGNIQRTVWEIAKGTYTGWTAFPLGATVVFIRDAAGTASSGAYSITATTAAGTFAQTKAGVASTDLFIPQTEWNVDRLLYDSDPDNSPSGFTLDPSKGNVYQVGIQYLGFGAINFQVEAYGSGKNNPEFITVHSLKFPNTLTASSFGNPCFPFTMAAYSAGSTTDVSVKSASFGGFIEGQKMLHGNRYSYYNASASVTSGAYLPLFSILNMGYFSGRTNQAVINLVSVAAAMEHNNPCVVYLIKNGTLTGNPNFSQYGTDSCSAWDTSATGITFSANNQLVWSGHLGGTGNLLYEFANGIQELTLQPGEYVTLAARSLGAGSPTFVTGSLNTREDQ